jgi:hypothetical protein
VTPAGALILHAKKIDQDDNIIAVLDYAAPTKINIKKRAPNDKARHSE